MDVNSDDLLTIGSVVKLKDSDVLVMIAGYTIVKEEKRCDYIGIVYPSGINSTEDFLQIKNEDIESIEHRGYSDVFDQKNKNEIMKYMKEL